MPKPHHRPPDQAPLDELAGLRLARNLTQGELATQLGITRLHLVSVERGRRRPSIDLVLRWLALFPDARLDMFGDLPTVEKRISLLRQIQQLKAA